MFLAYIFISKSGTIKIDKIFFFSGQYYIAFYIRILITLIIEILLYKLITPFLSGTDFRFTKLKPSIISKASYYRDIPLDGDIFKIYYVASQYGIAKKRTNIFGAFLLKWIRDGIVEVENRQKNGIFNKEETVIIFKGDPNYNYQNKYEKELYNFLYSASKDGELENKEFEKYCKSAYTRVYSWFEKAFNNIKCELKEESLINVNKKRGLMFNNYYKASEQLEVEVKKIVGLKRYLSEYTWIDKRSALEVNLFEDYLIVAQVLGIAGTVIKQFKNLYPEMIENTNFNSFEYLNYINKHFESGMRTAEFHRIIDEIQENYSSGGGDYSSGGGGYSSGGGGGGSFGGGGGGGGFR